MSDANGFPTPGCAVAIVGCAGRFPGAPDVATFWKNLCAGVESIRALGESALDDGFSSDLRSRPEFVKARSVVEGADEFDAGFFAMHAREAELTDPQHRLFLECSWQALEDAGYDPATFGGSIGVYAGCSIGSYLLRNVLGETRAIERFTSEYPVASLGELLGSGYDFLATRVAYKLDLRGPAMTLQSACSTSLLAVAQACQALMLRQADMMLAGGVSITFPQHRGYLYQAGGMVSPDGHCRTFDAHANGTVFGDGAGVVVLRRLEDALAANDSIYAVIRGFGVTNDGSGKVGYAAPSLEGQAAAVRSAHAMAGFEPATIGLIECHGTATPLGDPIELTALRRVFGPPANGRKTCALSSVKTNVGHLDVASGITGLIKAALAVRHGSIPATLHFESPNPHVDFANTPFFVSAQQADWPLEGPRRAGVSAFGVGGTNVHLALEESPAREARTADARPQLLVLSARSEAALLSAARNLATYLRAPEAAPLADVAHTLTVGRRPFAVRCAVTANSPQEAAAALEAGDRLRMRHATAAEPTLGFMFPGQGAQYGGMSRGLYDWSQTFRTTMDRCAETLQPILGVDLRSILFDEGSGEALTATAIAQPALFAVEYATAALLREFGITAMAGVGHSVGEFVAACLAGVFALEDALALVAERGRLMQLLPAGAMLSVRASEEQLGALLGEGLDVAALNAPELVVASGPHAAIERLERTLSERGIASSRLRTSHAFHSPMMDEMLEPFARRVESVRLAPPLTPYVSCVTGTWITAAEATSPQYWARHCRNAVRFADAVATLLDGGVDALVEVGPGATLATLALHGAAGSGDVATIETLPGKDRKHDDASTLLRTLGELWKMGAKPRWDALPGAAQQLRVALPTYPFERSRYWMEPNLPIRRDARAVVPESTLVREHGSEAMHEPKPEPSPSGTPRAPRLRSQLFLLLEELSGEDLASENPQATFVELGFDSLALGRFVQLLKSRLGVTLTFRQLLSDLPSVAALADHLDGVLAPEALPVQPAALRAIEGANGAANLETSIQARVEALSRMVREQLDELQRLAGTMTGNGTPAHSGERSAQAQTPARSAPPASSGPTDAFRIAGAAHHALSASQRAHIDDVVARTVARTPESKRLTERYRPVLADPRVAAGFRSEWKEMVYPITCVRAKGSRIWDADGNEYIDLLNGFGQTAFGHAPDFVVDAVSAQLQLGFAIGPQTQLAGEVAELFCELTGNERVTFCNTGSEAVMAALRVARTVTGRDRVVMFEGAYHGQFDEVLVKSARGSERSVPVALGIPGEAVANVTVLPYGTQESVEWVRAHRSELAAVLVEPVQSRHPELRPQAFLAELRTITEESDTALIFDEVVTGFRMHPAGMQEIFGIRADLATYGKVVGGGLPIGILAGKSRFMDALDGGTWQYGDDSFPEVAPTFIAGTFVRHPLAMAAVLAVLRRLKAQGPGLQAALTQRTAALTERLNAELRQRGIATRVESYGSMFFVNFAAEDRLGSLLYYHLRLRGIYIQEGFPCFLGTEHTDADVATIVDAFGASLNEVQAAGILPSRRAHDAPAAPDAHIEEVPLTEEQTEIWLSAQVSDDASCAFNESVTLHLPGALDAPLLRKAWSEVVNRHDALRATFDPAGQTMRIGPAGPVDFAEVTLTEVQASAGLDALNGIVKREARSPFDLTDGPLVRCHLVRLAPDEHALIITAHHIVCDGWSMNVLLGELAEIYSSATRGAEPQLAAPVRYAAHAKAQAERDPAVVARLEAYWVGQFEGGVRPLELPTDRPRPDVKSYRGATRTQWIGRDAYRTIKAAGSRQGCTLFVTLLTAFATLISRLCDQDDVVIGIPAAGQALLEGGDLVGHCVDFLPIRVRRESHATVAELASYVKRRVLDAYEHQEYTLGTLVRALAIEREKGRVPLAEVQFNLERLADGLAFAALDSRVEPNPKAFVNFDLFLNVVESPEGLRVDCDYNTDLFDAQTIDRWLAYFRNVLDAAALDGAQTVAGLDFRPQSERSLLARMNDTAADYPSAPTVYGLFADAAATYPDALALRFGAESLTYRELEASVNGLANHLRSCAGGPGRRIAICLERSPQLVTALLATLRAGCSYVPLDPAHPAARMRYIMEDARAEVLICDGAVARSAAPPGVHVVDLVESQAAIAAAPQADFTGGSAEDPAYTIYTSGSTGEPKGVEVTHRSVVNLLTSMARTTGIAPSDVLLAVTTVSFDIAALEFLMPLIAGATVVIASRDEVTDGFALVRRMRDVGTTLLQATPALWGILLDAGFQSYRGLKMLCGGEPLSRELAHRLLAGGGELWNVYGPTETTIWSSSAKLEKGTQSISVGTPLANTRFYVLDRNDYPKPIGTVGQLHIAGDGVACGYVNRPELTQEKFVADPFERGRMYRTGDLARVTEDGEVEVLGRMDHQVKLRGFRIELGEIESVIRTRANFPEVVVVLREDVPGERRLVCYYVDPGSTKRAADELRAFAAADLPDYMIPSAWVALERMPLSIAGKIDRNALPKPEPAAPPSSFRAPQTPTETILAGIWAEVFHAHVALDDDFFALGGDSIQLFQITARVNQSGLRLAAKELLKHPTIASLARRLDEAAREQSDRSGRAPSRLGSRVREFPAPVPERALAREQ